MIKVIVFEIAPGCTIADVQRMERTESIIEKDGYIVHYECTRYKLGWVEFESEVEAVEFKLKYL